MPVNFTFQFPKAKAAILYFAQSGMPEFTKGKLCKLLFLSDKLHLVRYGRPITGDSYAAMEHGPIPSCVLDILDAIEGGTTRTDEAVELAAALNLDRRFQYPRLTAAQRPSVKNLSDPDRCGGSVRMRFEDFFDEDEAALAGVLEEMIENCKLREAFPDPAWL